MKDVEKIMLQSYSEYACNINDIVNELNKLILFFKTKLILNEGFKEFEIDDIEHSYDHIRYSLKKAWNDLYNSKVYSNMVEYKIKYLLDNEESI